jgi:hypothetical protein
VTAAEHAEHASDLLTDVFDRDDPDRHLVLQLAIAHALTALALDVTRLEREADA